MQALLNFETELQKAFTRMQEDLDQHSAIFKRLEDDLKTVKLFEQPDYTDALNVMRETDSELYRAIREAYDREQFDGNREQHCQGIIAAIHAVYNLGMRYGFKEGVEYERKREK